MLDGTGGQRRATRPLGLGGELIDFLGKGGVNRCGQLPFPDWV
jgi:hypothetical protein